MPDEEPNERKLAHNKNNSISKTPGRKKGSKMNSPLTKQFGSFKGNIN